MSQQATQLAGDLPRYQHVLAEKISALRKSAVGSPALEKATEAVKGLERELVNPTPGPKVGTEPSPSSARYSAMSCFAGRQAIDKIVRRLKVRGSKHKHTGMPSTRRRVRECFFGPILGKASRVRRRARQPCFFRRILAETTSAIA